jgi:hypothetical protein
MAIEPALQEPGDLEPLRPVQQIHPTPVGSWRDRLPAWWPRAIFAVLAVALIGTGFFAYRLSTDLSAARATIATQSQQLATTNASLAAATARGEQLDQQVASLQAQVQTQQDCVTSLKADAATAQKIEDTQRQAYNLTAKDSAWAKADSARDAALIAVGDDYRQAALAILDGSYYTATTWLNRADSEITTANRNVATMNAEITKVNSLIDQVDGMLATVGSGLGVCASGGSSS